MNFSCFGKHGTSTDGYEYVCINCKQIKNQREEKRCNACRQTKKIIHFKSFRLGYHKFCIECEHKNEKYRQKETENNKKCSSCKIVKDINNFSRCMTSFDGYFNYCSDCSKEKSKKQKEKQKENKNKIKVEKKSCSNCKIEKDTDKNFYTNILSKDGFRSKCIECEKKLDKQTRMSKIK